MIRKKQQACLYINLNRILMKRCEQSDLRDLELVKTCDLCGGSKFSPEIEVNGWNLARCNGCGLVFTSPRYTGGYLQKLYSDRYYERASGYLFMQTERPSKDEHYLAKSLMKVCGIERKGLKLRSLDIGCGGGRIVEAFQNSGWEAVGTDLSLKAVNAGIKRGLDLRVVDLENSELGDFDLVTGFHILEHVHSPSRFLSQCTKRLRSNGYLLIEVPDYGSRQASRMGSSWPYLYPDGHLYQFTIATLSKYMAKGKFEVIQMQKVQGRGFLEDYSTCPTSRPQRQKNLKSLLFATRHLVYWSSICRKIIRRLFWHTLGYGEFLRVLAQKRN